MVKFIFVVVSGFAVFFGGLCNLARVADEHACRAFGEHSGRETKFVSYRLDYWDCLTPASDGTGRWISAHNLVENTGR